MKKFNKNSLLFIFAMVFIIIGISSIDNNVYPIYKSVKNVFINEYTIDEAKSNIESITTDELRYRDLLMDINSIKENLLGTRLIEKDDTIVIKSDSGSLIAPVRKVEKNQIQKTVEIINELKTVSENNGAKFLYCVAPSKELYQEAPTNTYNHSKENHNLFVSELTKTNVPNIDLANVIDENLLNYETFYYTDHHWTARSGFDANNAILTELNLRYGFEYDKEVADLSNYNIEKYEDWFLGSKGKKTGTYFTWKGADDFELIMPRFKTDIIEEQPIKSKIRKGEFKNTVLYMENMERDYYEINTYVTYGGGDFRLQIIKNNLNNHGKKVLLIRDSFAGVVAPFLALQTSELHICDVRDGDYYVGDKLNMKEYISKIDPDYVLVLYTGVNGVADSRYDFF